MHRRSPSTKPRSTQFRAAVGTRPLFLAASTHPGEEAHASRCGAQAALATNALTVIVPRHPGARAGDRSRSARARASPRGGAPRARFPSPTTEVYVADTLGELGLFYRAAPFAFLGGSLIPHGGQNPLEPARLGTAVLTGPHTHNFDETFRVLARRTRRGTGSNGRGFDRSWSRASLMIRRWRTILERRAQTAAAGMGGALKHTVDVAEALLARHARP